MLPVNLLPFVGFIRCFKCFEAVLSPSRSIASSSSSSVVDRSLGNSIGGGKDNDVVFEMYYAHVKISP
jgi:hypothetical protein